MEDTSKSVAEPDLPTSPETLLARLAELELITKTTEHAPLHTVEESRALRGEIPGQHCKTLFLKDKKSALWMVVVAEDRQLDMKSLARQIGAARLSFAKPELLWQVLGVRPGAVTPFALINDTEIRVKVVLDKAMLESSSLNYHPLVNTATTTIQAADLKKFIASCGHRPQIVDLDAD